MSKHVVPAVGRRIPRNGSTRPQSGIAMSCLLLSPSSVGIRRHLLPEGEGFYSDKVRIY